MVCLGAEEFDILYLTCVQDPAHAMTVQWNTGRGNVDTVVYYQKVGEAWWRPAIGAFKEVDGFAVWVHTVGLVGLEAGTDYLFKIGKGEDVYRFQTVPEDLVRKVRIAVGGDAYYGKGLAFRKMNQEIAAQDPDFVVLGGDIAYAIGRWRMTGRRKYELKRWQEFLRAWKEDMKTLEGKLIPLVVVIGNHDVPSGQVNPKKEPVMFYEMFSFPEKDMCYRALDVGSYLSLMLLDTDHTYPVEGKQTDWLKGALEERENRPYKMAVYHVAAYPAFYPFKGNISVKVRKNWVPLFEEYGVPVVFEHHNHCYKRTFRLKGGKVDEEGIWYLGDGSWGVPPRKPKSNWYLEKTEEIDAYYLVTLDKDKMVIEPRTSEGIQVEAPIEIKR